MEKCPVCKNEADVSNSTTSDKTNINCKRCGKYELSNTLTTILNANPNKYPKLSGVLREANENGDIKYLDTYTWEELNRNGEFVRLTDRMRKFIKYISNKTSGFGEQVTIDVYRDWAIGYCNDKEEFTQFLIELDKQGLIVAPNIGGTVSGDQYGKSLKTKVKLTYKAWVQLYESAEGINSNKVFLAYDFKDDEIDKAMTAVRALLTEIKLEPIDLKNNLPDHDQKITDKIIAEIRSAKFIIADCTVKNTNVYFEAGFAMGLNRPVLYVCKESNFGELSFDTNHYLHLPWDLDKLATFKEKLKERIYANKLL